MSKQLKKYKLCSSDGICHSCSSCTREEEHSFRCPASRTNKVLCPFFYFFVNRMLPMWKLALKHKIKQKAKHAGNVWFQVGGGMEKSRAEGGESWQKETWLSPPAAFNTKPSASLGAARSHRSCIWTPNPVSSPNVGRSCQCLRGRDDLYRQLTPCAAFTLPKLGLRYPGGCGSMYVFSLVLPVFR